MPTPEQLILKAAKNGDLTDVKRLTAENPALLHARDKDGSTPLHCAVWKGHAEVVNALLDAGADIHAHNQNDHWGTTPLHAAAHANHGPIVKRLIEHGADVNARNLRGGTPLGETSAHNAARAAKILKEHGAIE